MMIAEGTPQNNIWLIYDDAMIRDLLTELLSEEGYAVTILDGQSTLTIDKTMASGVLIIDLTGPQHLAAPRWELVRRLCAAEKNPFLAIVAATWAGYPTRDATMLLHAMGVITLTIPFDIDDVLSLVRKAFGSDGEKGAELTEPYTMPHESMAN